MVRIGIIGTAGRKEDADKMTRELYEKMKDITTKLINKISEISDSKEVILVSGGAAWSDHIAVDLFLSNLKWKLFLFLPCQWDDLNQQYLDLGMVNPFKNPGGTSNYYHRLFSKKLGRNSLHDIQTAIDKGANVKFEKGFHVRNNLVSQNIDCLIAFTWGTDSPKDGGTLHTWNCCKEEVKKLHIPLSSL